MSNLELVLTHYKMPLLGAEWYKRFHGETNVHIVEGDILSSKCDALVSPGNSIGFMDGGLDLLITKKYGWEIQGKLRKRIQETALRELLVGQAVVIETSQTPKYIICAPTMRVPERLTSESVNAYLAMKAILSQAILHPDIRSVAIPGLCTGTGGMSAAMAAHQMFMAYDEVVHGNHPEVYTYQDAKKHHVRLKQPNSHR